MNNLQRSIRTDKQLRQALRKELKLSAALLAKSKPIKAASPVHVRNPTGFRTVRPTWLT